MDLVYIPPAADARTMHMATPTIDRVVGFVEGDQGSNMTYKFKEKTDDSFHATEGWDRVTPTAVTSSLPDGTAYELTFHGFGRYDGRSKND